MLSLEQVWEILDNFSGKKKEKIYISILEILKRVDDSEARELVEDMLAFKDEMLSAESDPLKEIMSDTYTKKEAAEIFNISEKTVQREISRGLLEPVNPGRKPLRFSFNDLKEVFASNVKHKHGFLDYTVSKFSSPFFSEYFNLSKSKKIASGSFEDLVEYECEDKRFGNHGNYYGGYLVVRERS